MVITNYKELPCKLTFHLAEKLRLYNKSLWAVRDIINTGRIIHKKSYGRKVVLKRYYGKENMSYYLVLVVRKEFNEVVTIWQEKGK